LNEESDMIKRQADVTRTLLIRAAGDAISEAGATTFTLDGVAKRAGLSKGALLHHFPTKSVLVEAVVRDLVDQFWNDVQAAAREDSEPNCRMTRAYILTIARLGEKQNRRWGGLATAFVVDPSLLHLWRDTLRRYQQTVESETQACESAWIARLAVDSLWSAELFGTPAIGGTSRAKLIERLVGLTYPIAERDKQAA
jgi:AcrR family transcriptional regulator